MAVRTEHVLAVAVSTGKVGYAFLIDGVPYDWGLSLVASGSTRAAYEHTRSWIEYYQPELVVTERIGRRSRKQTVSRALANAILKAAQDSNVAVACVDRVQRYANKYAEAEAIAERFPELKPYLPRRRRLWDSEPRRIIIFEAVSLALSIIDSSPPNAE